MMMQMLVHQMIFILLLSICRASTAAPQMAKPGCQDKCGDVTIPFPFGIGPDESCYYDEWFRIDCNASTEWKPFLRRTNLTVLNISTKGTLQVYSPVTFFCEGIDTSQSTFLYTSPFVYSQSDNIFTAFSCNYFASWRYYSSIVVGGCWSACGDQGNGLGCDISINCCQTSISHYLTGYYPTLEDTTSTLEDTTDCSKFAFLVDKYWFQNTTTSSSTVSDIRTAMKSMRRVPVTLDWSINDNSTGPFDFDRSIVSFNGSTVDFDLDANPSCVVSRSRPFGWLEIDCSCPSGYEGNPYLGLYSCHDIDECQDPDQCFGNKKCVNEYGSYRCEDDRSKDDRSKAKLILAAGVKTPNSSK